MSRCCFVLAVGKEERGEHFIGGEGFSVIIIMCYHHSVQFSSISFIFKSEYCSAHSHLFWLLCRHTASPPPSTAGTRTGGVH